MGECGCNCVGKEVCGLDSFDCCLKYGCVYLWGKRERGECVCGCDCVDVNVIVWMGVGVIAWVRKGVCGWESLDCCLKCVCVLGEKGRGSVCVGVTV